MRLSKPRVEPVDLDRLDDEQQDALKGFLRRPPVINIFRTMARTPDALKAFLGWGNYILSDRNAVPAREREIAILRAGYNCRSGYEFAQHTRVGKRCGLTDAEIAAIKQGPDAENWNELDRAILKATDELTSDFFVTDETWAALAPLGDKGRTDLIYTVGQYTQVSMILNTLGVQVEDGTEVDPELRP